MPRSPKGFAPEYDIARLLTEKLASSGLDDTDAKALKLTPHDASHVREMNLPWRLHLPFFSIPYTSPWGDDWGGFIRARLLAPQPTPETPKYTQTKDTFPHVYFPTNLKGKQTWKQILTDPEIKVYITEGELKAAAATKRGYPTIGLGGVWNFKSKRYDIKFLKELDRVVWTGREVVIIYDSDLRDKPDVQRAKQVLANELIERGAIVFTIDIESPSDKKVGLDDLLLTVTNAEFDVILEDAYQMEYGWQLMYQSKDGKPFATVRNAEVAFSLSPPFDNLIYWDDFRKTEMLTRPMLGKMPRRKYPRPIEDVDYGLALSWLQDFEGGCITKASPQMVHTAMTNVAIEDIRHPIIDYLDGLHWDGTPRLSTWLSHAFGVDRTPYTEAVARYFFMGMVARVRDPGCQLDYMLVIEGDQGLRKSTICRELAGGEDFFATMTHEKDVTRVSQLLRGKWVIEVDELSAIKRSDIEEIKGFVTRRNEKYIAKYARKQSDEARSCVFIGTTNEFEYLRDVDNRRFWPVRAIKDDIEWLRQNRDQLFAEADHLVSNGEQYYPERDFEKLYFKPEQDARRVFDDVPLAVSEFAELKAIEWARETGRPYSEFEVVPRDIVNSPKFIEERMGNVSQKVNQALRMLGWTVYRRVHNVPRYRPSGPAVKRIEDRAAMLAQEREVSEKKATANMKKNAVKKSGTAKKY